MFSICTPLHALSKAGRGFKTDQFDLTDYNLSQKRKKKKNINYNEPLFQHTNSRLCFTMPEVEFNVTPWMRSINMYVCVTEK